MGYIQEIEEELQTRLANLEEREQKEVIRFVKEKILESYKNGIAYAKPADAGKEATRTAREFSRRKR